MKMIKRNSQIKATMNNGKDYSNKKEKIEKKCKNILKLLSKFFRIKCISREIKYIENDNLSDISNSATIGTSEDCYFNKQRQLKNYDLSSEATLYTSNASSVFTSTNDIYNTKINSSAYPNDFNPQNNIYSFDNISKQPFLKHNITNASFYSPSKSPCIIPSGDQIPLKLEDRYDSTIPVINNRIAEQIRTRIPALYKEAIHWKLLYSIDQHGLSLKTLYSNIKHAGPCVMAITTKNNEIFGAFTSEPFDPSISNNYYGSGLSFIWKVNDHDNVDFYQSMGGSNQYYILADNHFIAMGGGNGKFGFYLNENLIDGYISPCMTFNYDSSIIENENFECYGLEIWGFEF